MTPLRVAQLTLAGVGGCVAVVALGWLSFACVSFVGYGKIGVDRATDAVLDRFMPVYEVSERHQTVVNAPAEFTFAAAHNFRLDESPIIRAIFRAREVILRARSTQDSTDTLPLLEQTKRLGWGVLASESGRLVVMGAVTQPWRADVTFRALPPAEFAAFHEPDYVKIVWTLEAQPLTKSTSIFRTITRVKTTDAQARQKFRRYWALFSPGILLIRKESLRIVRAQAERRFVVEGY
jgi:hypothetical protein